jgi:hypothetical protein
LDSILLFLSELVDAGQSNTPRAVLDKFAAIQMLSRYTELTADQKLLARQLKLDLPPQKPPRITAPEKIARLPANAV